MACIKRLYANEVNTRSTSGHSVVCFSIAHRRRRCHCHAERCEGCLRTAACPVDTRQIRATSRSASSLSPVSKRPKRCVVKQSGAESLILLLLLLLSGLATAQESPVPSPGVGQTAAPTSPSVVTLTPTLRPSTSSPTLTPTNPTTLRPSDIPSAPPSRSPAPSISSAPSVSVQPSGKPSTSLQPSPLPSSVLPSSRVGRYRHDFVIETNSTFFNETEILELANLFESYTPEFAIHDPMNIDTRCAVNEDQNIFTEPGEGGQPPRQILTLDYRCQYLSNKVDPDEYPDLFVVFVNSDLPNVTIEVQAIAPTVIEALAVVQVQSNSPAPTFTMIPSYVPSPFPSTTVAPSFMPSDIPTTVPTAQKFPTVAPSTSSQPSSFPTSVPTIAPTAADDGPPVGLIAGVVVAIGLAGLGGLVVFYRRSKQSRATLVSGGGTGSSRTGSGGRREPSSVIRSSRTGVDYGGDTGTDAGVVILPSDSIVSNKSFLSAGDDGIGDESGDEADGTKNLQDEFDQYKDQTLEQFRSNVEGNLTGFEGIMSAAVTKALMGDEDDNVDERELLWGCESGANGAEIEASALCEVSDWIKRNETAPAERKRVFMKEVLNRMVTSVRLGAMHANDGSRTIHECAALLGLQLKHELPMTTVIISGMRKTVGANEMVKVLREFGEIDVCAVASGQRGFGIVRFRNTKSVDRAMRRYRGGEIVVQDVAIQMKVLNPSGLVDS